MDTTKQNEAAARRCVDLFNQKQITAWVEACYAENAEWIELPRPATPNGQRGNRDFLRQVSEGVLKFVPDRQMEIRNLIAQDDQVVLELDWRGTTAAPLGSLLAGSVIRYRVATFLTFVDGMIARETDYCIPIRESVAVLGI
jgi:ketosteroid isomerase-like protein